MPFHRCEVLVQVFHISLFYELQGRAGKALQDGLCENGTLESFWEENLYTNVFLIGANSFQDFDDLNISTWNLRVKTQSSK